MDLYLPIFWKDPITITILFIALFYLYFTWNFDFWGKRNVPFRKPTILLGNFGDLLLFKKSQLEGMKDMYNWFPDARFFGVFRVRSPILVLRDPELIKTMYVKDFYFFPRRGIPINPKEILMNHIFHYEGNKWKVVRSKLTSVFSSVKIKHMLYLLVECQKVLDARISDTLIGNAIVDVRELAVKFTVDVIGSCAFGININSLCDQNSQFHETVKKIYKPSYKKTLWRMLRTSMPRLYKLLDIRMIDPDVTKFFQDLVSQMIRQREQDQDNKRRDFMDILIDLKNYDSLLSMENGVTSNSEDSQSDKIDFDENMIAAHAFTFFVAGLEPSANTIAFCLHELAVNPEIQHRVREEISRILEKHGGVLNYESLQEMTYIDAVVRETLRKYPPAPLISRLCEHPYQIPGTKIELPAGIRVIIPIYGIHHDPNYYPEPDRFDPNRFYDKVQSSIIPHTYFAFGEGPRNCIGQRFGMVLVKVGIISFLRNCEVQVCEKTDIPIKFSRRSPVTTSDNGFWLKLGTLW